ncbi:unnamed protein product [Candidula unifasciata]|uniref:Uncharacterized protein n=1 Tax=Candidula unifasciata TaxID=100452 RepID=A0A8S3Z5J6_9EUPU|nr:unnamed protein product [Candidula unifasciata]
MTTRLLTSTQFTQSPAVTTVRFLYKGKTKFNVLRIRVRKTTPESRAFTFTMRVRNDLGPPMEFEKDTASWTGQTLEPSVIAGIAVAGSIVVIAVILLAIYLCIRARSSNLKDESFDAPDNKSSEYFSSRNENTLESQKKYLQQGVYSTNKESSSQWRPQEPRPPRRVRPPVPEPTQPAPRDPGRRGLSDRHRSGERTARSTSQSHTGRRGRESVA